VAVADVVGRGAVLARQRTVEEELGAVGGLALGVEPADQVGRDVLAG
jgi:hypothetical protein